MVRVLLGVLACAGVRRSSGAASLRGGVATQLWRRWRDYAEAPRDDGSSVNATADGFNASAGWLPPDEPMFRNRTVASFGWADTLRALFIEEGSTCLLTGGGVVPYFNSCVGCSLTAAHQCVADMRANASFNVPVNCNMDSVGSMAGAYTNYKNIENRRCCALKNNEFTYAYRDALRCLNNIYCSASAVYASLEAECELVCPVANASVWDFSCTPSQFGGASGRSAGALALVAPLAAGAALLLF